MVKDEILRAYETMAQRYHELIDHKPHNAYYDRPNTLSLIAKPAGKAILDAACGPGKYAEILLSQGAEVTGFDFSPQMVKLAQTRNQGAGKFFRHDLTAPLSMFADGSFDLVLCALALHYVEDWTLTMREFHRVLKPHGQVVVSIEHPFFEYLFFTSDSYFQVEHVACTWKGFGQAVEVNSYRRPLGECLQPFTDNGFYIDQLIEPKPTEAFKRADPKHYEELNAFPAFMCMRAVRRE